MKNTANELIYIEGDSIEDKLVDITVSNDGSWQKRCYSLLNGVVTVTTTGSGKCVDFRVFTKTCNACTSLEKITDQNYMSNL